MLRLRSVLASDSGQGLVEYGLILAFVALVAIASLSLLGVNVTTALTTVAGDV